MNKRVGIALSGGGVRAMVFHAGVMRWLAEHELLEQIDSISSVSGGSLFTGLVYKINGWRWPTSQQYLDNVLPELRRILTTVCLQSKATRLLLFSPSNWRFILSRSNILASAIVRAWGVDLTIADLPSKPEWSANGTTAETGRRFRFKQGRCGDYEIGYSDAKHFKIAEAMAASAAYPLLIGPLQIDASKLAWFKRPHWGGSEQDESHIELKYRKLHIMDGGVYDNLGMEPLFDTGTSSLKDQLDFVMVSDAGASLRRGTLASLWRLKRLTRVLEISMDQVRALRVRPFVNAIIQDVNLGRYYQIGSEPMRSPSAKESESEKNIDEKINWLKLNDIESVSNWPTDLKRIPEEIFDLLCEHGYQTAAWNENLADTSTNKKNGECKK